MCWIQLELNHFEVTARFFLIKNGKKQLFSFSEKLYWFGENIYKLLTFLTDSMNCNAEFQDLMKIYLIIMQLF